MNARTCTTPLGRTIEIARASPLKRPIDFCLAAIALIGTSPVFLVTALMIKLTGKGPVFYRGQRLGMGGKVYQMLKFRSMKAGAPPVLTDDGKIIVMKRDSRVTGIGRIIRATKIDELPQLLNVLKGDMSVVGPRSGLPEYEKDYSDMAYERLRVRPGMSGLGSVLDGRHLSNECLYEIEARYVERQGFVLDLLIVVMTPVYVIFGAGIVRRILKPYLRGIAFRGTEGASAES